MILDKFVEKLQKIALYSALNQKHAAAVIGRQHIYSVAFNQFIKKSPISQRTIHAEINALCKFSKKSLKGMDILVIRTNKNLTLSNSRPCNHCINKMISLGIRKVYYSDKNGNIIYEYVEEMEKYHISSANRRLNT